MTEAFYDQITGFSRFAALTDPQHYSQVPADWHVVMTDIRGSTKAIQAGRYKDVNMVGAATIMVVLNCCKHIGLPYVFGGDGSTLLVPDSKLEDVLRALTGVQAHVKQLFNMELRVGSVALADVYAKGTQLGVGKYYLSEHVSQAVFQGDALALAERWLKDGGGPVRLCEAKEQDDVDLTGLECRWEPIENRNGTMLSVLVRVAPGQAGESWRIYAELLAAIGDIYPDIAAACPTKVDNMRISLSPKRLRTEVLLRAGNNKLKQLLYLMKILVINMIGRLSFTQKKVVLGFDGKRYLSELVANSDVRKFDEMLRMVLDSTSVQQQALEALLEERRLKGQIVYGLHSASHALMTCLVFNLAGNHVHFIDGADGGYAMAALHMKQQLASLSKGGAYAAG